MSRSASRNYSTLRVNSGVEAVIDRLLKWHFRSMVNIEPFDGRVKAGMLPRMFHM